MDYKCRINEIEKRAAAIGVAIRDLCAEAGVNASTYWRWQKPDANPRLRDMDRALASMEAFLTRRELEMLGSLANTHPTAAANFAASALRKASHAAA